MHSGDSVFSHMNLPTMLLKLSYCYTYALSAPLRPSFVFVMNEMVEGVLGEAGRVKISHFEYTPSHPLSYQLA